MNQKNQIKIIITGGGTGGHVIPLMAIVDELKKKKVEILYIGSGMELEKDLANKKDIKYKAIFAGKWRRYFDLNNYLDIFKIIIGFVQCFFIVLFFGPNIIFSKGGYVGLPVVWAAWILGKPIYLHETDSILGLANKMLISKCQKIFVGYPPKYYPEIPANKVIYTGNPIREDFKQAKKEKIFRNDQKTIFVTGGSQGARFLNQTIAKIVPELSEKYNTIHISGKLDYEWLLKNKKDWKNYKLVEFATLEEFAQYLKNCDLVISRAGGTIAEIAYCKKPAIIIPLPLSANNHQESNAQILEQENAAIVLREKGLTSESLLEIINRLMEDSKLAKELGEKISQFATENAVKNITSEILK